MEYFPFYMDIENIRCLVVGGGKTALHKINVLLPFKPIITVTAPEICKEILEIPGIETRERGFEERDLDNVKFVISATNDNSLNRRIYKLCLARNIPINSVDDKQSCTFIFPAIVKKKSVTAAVSTGGKSPVCARFLKQLIDNALDDNALNAVEILGAYREKIQSSLTSTDKRRQAFEALLDLCLTSGNDICSDDVDDIIKAVKNKNEN